MDKKENTPFEQKRIALIAHDHKRDDLLARTKFNLEKLSRHILFATGKQADCCQRNWNYRSSACKVVPWEEIFKSGKNLPKGNICIDLLLGSA